MNKSIKILSITFFIVVISCLSPFFLFAATPVKPAGPTDLPTVQGPEPLEVYWKERDGAILLETVCFNYSEESKENKGCRRLAIKKFREECGRYQKLYHDSRPYYDEDYRRQMEKYCAAANDFTP